MRRRRQHAAILCACVVGDEAALGRVVPGSNLTGLVDLAVEHRVAPLVFAGLRAVDGVDPDVMRLLGAAWLENRMAGARLEEDLSYFREVIATLGVPWLIVKGPAIATTLYDPPETRSVGDLDVLVAPADFPRVVEVLEAAGHPVDDANWELVLRELAGQLHLWLPAGTPLDLHWSLLYSRTDRARFRLSTEDLLERRRPITTVANPAFALDRVDTLVHLCVHAAAEGGDRLSWLADIHRAWGSPGVTPSTVAARCREWGVELPVGTMLIRTRSELGTGVPDELVRALVPKPWRIAIGLLARVSPVARSTRRWGDPVSLLTRGASQARTPGRALSDVLGGLRTRGRQLLRDRSPERVERRRPDDIHLNRGDDRERQAYLRELANMAPRR